MGCIMEVFVGEELIGCIVNLFGQLVDGLGLILISKICLIESQVLGVMDCKLVYELL